VLRLSQVVKVGFGGCFRVEAQGFQSKIWVVKKPEDLDVRVIHSHAEYKTIEVNRRRHVAQRLMVLYASPHV